MKIHKSLWLGLFIVLTGWAMLFTEAQLNLLIATFNTGENVTVSSVNLGIIAQCTILSGFGIAILGSIQTGFSALNQFVDGVLARSVKPNLELPLDLREERRLPSLMRLPREAVRQMPLEKRRSREGLIKLLRGKDLPILQPNRKVVEQTKSTQRRIVERGWVKDRAYVLFADGAVEVETMLGLRRFPSLQDAQDFIS